ncbi:MAG: aspartate aminotransferase family protein [Bacteroidota bacterium]
MKSNEEIFLKHIAQTSCNPILLEVERAQGCYIYSKSGKKYVDLISGISVANTGHSHPSVVKAIQKQAGEYLHTMVYGEFVIEPQVRLAEEITKILPSKLSSVFFVNSGSEAVEVAMKMARRHTGRTEIISFQNAYHGSTMGALSLSSSLERKKPFEPLVPDIIQIPLNQEKALEKITQKTAAVFVEPIQGEAGIRVPDKKYMQALRKHCSEKGALLVFDEIQTGMGRTGKMFAFEHFGIVPDVLLLAKAFGGGLPLGAMITSQKIMKCLTHDPVLGHITTFGGNPLCCSAGLAALQVMQKNKLTESVSAKEKLFRKLLIHPKIKEIRGKGLLLAIQLKDAKTGWKMIHKGLEKGFIIDSFLYDESSLRLTPPLIMKEIEIEKACKLLLQALDEV